MFLISPQSTNYLTLSRSSSPTACQKKAGNPSRSTTPTSPMFAKLFSARLADYARAEGGDWSQRSSVALEEAPVGSQQSFQGYQRLPVSPCTSPAIRQSVSSVSQTERKYFDLKTEKLTQSG